MTKAKIGPLYVVMLDGSEGPVTSFDAGRPRHTLKSARAAIKNMGPEKSRIYYVVRFVADKQFGKARP